MAESEQEPDDELTDEEKEILKFESKGWRQRGAKESAIRDEFHWTPWRYYQRLNRIIEKPAAIMFDPALVARLRRIRDRNVALKYVRE